MQAGGVGFGKFEDAQKAIKNSIVRSPNNAETYKIEAEIYFKKERFRL